MSRKPAPSPDSDCCATCFFWREDTDHGDERTGDCRRFPGMAVSDGEGVYTVQPSKAPDDWCGEFKRRTQ